MRYIMKPTFEPGALTGLKAHNVEEAWNTLVRMTGFDLPEGWTPEDMVYVSHTRSPYGFIHVTFETPDTNLEWFEKHYEGYNLEKLP